MSDDSYLDNGGKSILKKEGVTSEVSGTELEELPESEQKLLQEKLGAVAQAAEALVPLMTERYEGKFSRKFMSPAQAEAFSHSFAIAVEALKVGAVEEINEELRNVTACFTTYGDDGGSPVIYDTTDSLGRIGRQFYEVRRNFSDFATVAEKLPGINEENLRAIDEYFGNIHTFHKNLHESVRKIAAMAEEDVVEDLATNQKEEVTPEQNFDREKFSRLGKLLDEVAYGAKGFAARMQDRQRNDLTVIPIEPQKARQFAGGLEQAAEVMKKGDTKELTNALVLASTALVGYGEDRSSRSGYREDIRNLRAMKANFSDVLDTFNQFVSRYNAEDFSDDNVSRILLQMRTKFSDIDDYNRRLLSKAMQIER